VQLALLITNILVLLSFIIFAALAKYYFPSYIKEKAKNLATKEDIAQITDEMEKVKAEYTKALESYKSEIWHEQQKLLWLREEYKLKIETFKRSTKLINQFNDKIVNHQIYASSRDLALAISNTQQPLEKEVKDFYRSEYESFRVKAEKSYLEFRDLSFEIGELAALLSIYFENKLYDLALDIRNKGNQAIKAALTPAQIAENIETILAQGKDLNSAKMIISEAYDAAYDHLIPKKDAHDFFELIKKAAENARA
jgi:hypothetical protein